MANPFEQIERRERGTIAYWDADEQIGHIKTDGGETVFLSSISVVQGFRQLAKGQRVEFVRIGYGRRPRTAAMVVALPADAGFL